MRVQLGQVVVVENKPGATGQIGAQHVARSEPDGHTLLVGHSDNVVIHPLMQGTQKASPDLHLEPIAFVGRIPGVLIAQADSGISDGKELIIQAKRSPGRLKLASWGLGSSVHLASELMNQIAGIELMHVPYGGVPAAMAGFYSGQVDLIFVTAEIALTAAATGKARIVGTSSKALANQRAGIPWLGDQGFPGLDMDTWYGILAPKGIDPKVAASLNTMINQQLQTEFVADKLSKAGLQLQPVGRSAFIQMIERERTLWARLIEQRHIPPLEGL